MEIIVLIIMITGLIGVALMTVSFCLKDKNSSDHRFPMLLGLGIAFICSSIVLLGIASSLKEAQCLRCDKEILIEAGNLEICDQCEVELAEDYIKKNDPENFCSGCGEKIVKDNSYCGKCGNKY